MANSARRDAPLRLLVVDDHPVVRAGLLEMFRDEPGLTVCAQAASIAEALRAVVTTAPDVAIVDLSLGRESGLDLLATLAHDHPDVRVLVLSGHDEQLYAERALKAGALGYVMKDRAATDLVAAVRRVAAGKSSISDETAERILSTMGSGRRPRAADRSPLDRLSDREHHVLRLLGQGLATREIASALEVSPKTIESHVAHLKEKLGAKNGRELARLAVSWTDALVPGASPAGSAPRPPGADES